MHSPGQSHVGCTKSSVPEASCLKTLTSRLQSKMRRQGSASSGNCARPRVSSTYGGLVLVSYANSRRNRPNRCVCHTAQEYPQRIRFPPAEPIDVLYRLFREFAGKADSNWAKAGGRIFKGQRELAILGVFCRTFEKSMGPDAMNAARVCRAGLVAFECLRACYLPHGLFYLAFLFFTKFHRSSRPPQTLQPLF